MTAVAPQTGMAPRATNIVFDLDGTLVESAPAVRDIANAFMAERGHAPLDLDETRRYMGNGAAVFLERALIARCAFDRAAFATDLERFHAHYAEAPPEANRPLPGVDDALRVLAGLGYGLAICTNKPYRPTRALIDAMGWRDIFGVVVAGDTLEERKPDAAPLIEAIRRLGGGGAVYVGDSEVDEETARRANVPFVLFTAGYRKREIGEMTFAAAFDTFAELPDLVAVLAAQQV